MGSVDDNDEGCYDDKRSVINPKPLLYDYQPVPVFMKLPCRSVVESVYVLFASITSFSEIAVHKS